MNMLVKRFKHHTATMFILRRVTTIQRKGELAKRTSLTQCSFPSLDTRQWKLCDVVCQPGWSIHPAAWPLPTAWAFYSIRRARPQPGLGGNSLHGDTPLQGRAQRQDIHFITRQPHWRVQRLIHHTFCRQSGIKGCLKFCIYIFLCLGIIMSTILSQNSFCSKTIVNICLIFV